MQSIKSSNYLLRERLIKVRLEEFEKMVLHGAWSLMVGE